MKNSEIRSHIVEQIKLLENKLKHTTDSFISSWGSIHNPEYTILNERLNHYRLELFKLDILNFSVEEIVNNIFSGNNDYGIPNKVLDKLTRWDIEKRIGELRNEKTI